MPRKLVILLSAVGLFVLTLFTIDFIIPHWQLRWMPSEKKLAAAMADIYLADGMLQQVPFSKGSEKRNDIIYTKILDRYGISKEVYDSALQVYSKNPADFSLLYDKVIAILSKKEAEFDNYYLKYDSIETCIKQREDSATHRLWGRRPTFVRLPLSKKDTISKEMLFTLKKEEFKDLKQSGYLNFKANYTFTRSNKNKDTASVVLIAHYDNKLTDTVSCPYNKERSIQRNFNINMPLPDSTSINRLDVYLIKQKNLKDVQLIISGISLNKVDHAVADTLKNSIILPNMFNY